MPRMVKDARLENRTSRLKLPTQHAVHWKAIDAGRHLGYRRGKRKPSWVARFRTDEGKYLQEFIGLTDDVQDADGSTVLTFSQAQEKARTWFAAQANGDPSLLHDDDAPETVADVIENYLEWHKHHRKNYSAVRYSADAHILPALGRIKVADFADPHKAKAIARRIRRFQQDLATKPARLRTRPGEKQKYRPAPDTPEKERARKATANKVLTMLKAALNQAYNHGDITSDAAWKQVKPFREVDAPKIRFLSGDEVVRLVTACTPDFRPLVQGAVLSGCRYGELCRLTVSDFNEQAASLFIAESKSGKSRTVYLTDEGVSFFEQQTAGKLGDELIFTRADGEPWKKSHQARPMRDACARAKITPAISFHILRHCYGSRLAMQGVSMKVIADQLGHSDTRITEKHYAHLSRDHVADTVRNAFGTLGVVEEPKVVSLRHT